MDKIILASLSTSVAGILAIYLAAAGAQPDSVAISDISEDMVGKTVSTEGVVKTETTSSAGNMFLTLTDGRKDLQVPVFTSVAQGLDEGRFKPKSRIAVTGEVDVYKGQLQVIPSKPGDLVTE